MAEYMLDIFAFLPTEHFSVSLSIQKMIMIVVSISLTNRQCLQNVPDIIYVRIMIHDFLKGHDNRLTSHFPSGHVAADGTAASSPLSYMEAENH